MKNIFIALILSLSAIAAVAGDRIGNGGGVWACEGPQKEIYDYMFMDVFEARREYQLTLPELQVSATQFLKTQKAWILTSLPQGQKIVQHIEYVEKNITWIDDIINSIPDAANKISPHPSTCKQGEWKAVQLVNFTDDFRVLVRREIFESPLLTDLERVAVYVHEGVYSYLRSEYSDSNSVRARAIVAVVLSDLKSEDKTARILKVLNQTPAIDPPTPPASWMCGLKPQRFSPLYVGEGLTEAKAKETTLQICKKGESATAGLPGVPDIPGFPNPGPDDFGPARECRVEKILCEPILSQEKKITCEMPDFFDRRKFIGKGRTTLEAQSETMKQCLAYGGSESSCYDASAMECK